MTRMLSTTFTAGTFRNGMNMYLTDNAYDAVTEDDLWRAVQAAAEQDGTQLGWDDVAGVFSPWSRQPGTKGSYILIIPPYTICLHSISCM